MIHYLLCFLFVFVLDATSTRLTFARRPLLRRLCLEINAIFECEYTLLCKRLKDLDYRFLQILASYGIVPHKYQY